MQRTVVFEIISAMNLDKRKTSIPGLGDLLCSRLSLPSYSLRSSWLSRDIWGQWSENSSFLPGFPCSCFHNTRVGGSGLCPLRGPHKIAWEMEGARCEACGGSGAKGASAC